MGACGVAIEPHNIAFGVDPKGLGEGSTGDVDRSERIVVSVVVAFSPAQKKAMDACGVAIEPHNIAFGVYPKGLGEGSTVYVDRSERIVVSVVVAFSPAQKKAMGACGVAIDAHNIAFGVDPKGLGEGSTGDVDRSERIVVSVVVAFSPAQKKAMDACGVAIEPHNIAFGVDPKSLGEGSTGDVDRSERIVVSVVVAFSPAQKKAMSACGVAVEPHNIAFGGDPKGLGGGSTGDIDGGETVVVCKTTADHANGKQQGKAQGSKAPCSCNEHGRLF